MEKEALMLLRRMVLLLLMLALTVFSAQAEDSFSVVDDEDGVVYDNLLPDAQAPRTVTLTFAGDVTLGSEEDTRNQASSFFSVAQREGYGWFFREMQPLFSTDDLTIVNLEGVLADSPQGMKKDKNYCFRGDVDMARILTLGNIEAVTLGNNHSGDYGQTGLQSTQRALQRAGVEYFVNGQAYVWRRGNISIAFFGFWQEDYQQNRDWMAAEIARMKAEEGLSAAVVCLHAGYEYRPQHNATQEEFAHDAIDAGGDLVIMHHPHVVQGVEVYKGRTICYSLGNFCFGGNRNVREPEALAVRVKMTFSPEGVYQSQQVTLIPVHISGEGAYSDYQPRMVQGEAAQRVFDKVQADTAFALPAPDETTGWVTLSGGYTP